MREKKLHIGFLTTEYIIPPNKLAGGLATYIQRVAYELIDQNHSVSVFCLSNRDNTWVDNGVDVYEVNIKRNFPYIRMSNFFPPLKQLENIFIGSKRLAKFVGIVHKIKPLDIIQASSYKSVGLTLCNNAKIPIVTRISSISIFWRNKEGQENSISSALIDWAEIYQIEQSDGVFSPSELMSRYFSLFSIIKPKVIRTPFPTLPFNLDTSIYDNFLSGKKYLLFFGQISRKKGIEVISKIIPKIISDFPDIYFVFVGYSLNYSDDETFIDRLLLENHLYKNNIIAIEILDKKKLFPIIQKAYAVLIPSLIDNYPNTCLEAQHQGKIIIGTKDSSLEEMIMDGKTGFLVENNDSLSLEKGIRNLLNLSNEDYHTMEENVNNRFMKDASEDRVDSLLTYYSKIISEFPKNKSFSKINLEKLLLLDKLRINFWIGLLPKKLLYVLRKTINICRNKFI